MQGKRPDWDEYFMNIAHVVKTRSNCSRRQVGTIIVKDKKIISTGYCGTPKKIKNCNEGGCERCSSSAPSGTQLEKCLCCHAEENSIVFAALHGSEVNGAEMYTTLFPCTHCAKLIINAGFSRVVAGENYADETGAKLLMQAGVKFEVFQNKI